MTASNEFENKVVSVEVNMSKSQRNGPVIEVTTGAGPRGMRGESAYDVAARHGFAGTEAEWIASLKGDPGYDPVRGVDYWTDDDIQAVVQEAIDAALTAYPVAEEAEF